MVPFPAPRPSRKSSLARGDLGGSLLSGRRWMLPSENLSDRPKFQPRMRRIWAGAAASYSQYNRSCRGIFPRRFY